VSFTKYQKAEKVTPVSPDEGRGIQAYVQKLGKKSAAELTPEERDGLPQKESQ